MPSDLNIDLILLVAALLLLAGVFASKASSRFGIPALLLFVAVGMVAGSEGLGGIPYDDPKTAQFLGVVALTFILFAGGLHTDRKALARIFWRGLSLATVGVLITATLVGWFTTVVLGGSWLEGLLLGAIISSTDAAAVFSVLQSQQVRLKGGATALLEFESGSNDPMAVFLTIALVDLLKDPGASWISIAPLFLMQMLVGGAVGFAAGKITTILLNWLRIETEGLYPVATLAAVLMAYASAALLHGSGFLAVYVAGIVLSDSDFVHKRTLIQFHDAVAWLMQIIMFLVLGLLVFPSRLVPVAGAGSLIALFLMFVGRPIAVMVALSFTRMEFRQRLLIAWVGLRGAVPIVLATFPLLAGLPRAQLYFNVVFFIVLASVLLQGTTLRVAARWLRQIDSA